MRLRRFNEQDQVELSHDRCDDITDKISDMLLKSNQDLENVNLFINELDQFRSKKQETNDQIDNAISNLQLVRGELSEINDKYDNIINDINDYKDSGRDMLY